MNDLIKAWNMVDQIDDLAWQHAQNKLVFEL